MTSSVLCNQYGSSRPKWVSHSQTRVQTIYFIATKELFHFSIIAVLILLLGLHWHGKGRSEYTFLWPGSYVLSYLQIIFSTEEFEQMRFYCKYDANNLKVSIKMVTCYSHDFAPTRQENIRVDKPTYTCMILKKVDTNCRWQK